MSRIRLPIRFQHAGRPVRGETLHADADADVLVLTSCSAQLGIELRSAYVGAGEEREEVLAAERAAIGGRQPDLRSRWLESAAGALVDQRRHLLLEAAHNIPPSAVGQPRLADMPPRSLIAKLPALALPRFLPAVPRR